MRIWDEELIPKICDNHLVKMWQDVWDCFDEITENPGKKHKTPEILEFQACPLMLVHRMEMVYKEAGKRGYSVFIEPPDPYSVSDQVLLDGVKEMKYYVPWLPLKDQILLLKSECIYCRL